MNNKAMQLLLAFSIGLGGMAVVGCDDRSDTEKAIDRAAENTKDAAKDVAHDVKEGTKKAADKVDDAAKKTADKVKDATN